MNKDIIICSQYGNNVRLLCNFFDEGKSDILNYYISNKPNNIESIVLKQANILLENLDFATYIFYYCDSDNNVCDSIEVNISGQSLEEELTVVLRDDYKILTEDLNISISSTVLEDLAACYFKNEDIDTKEKVANILSKLTKYYNILQKRFNDSLIDIDIKNLIYINLFFDTFYDTNYFVEIEMYNTEKNKWEHQLIKKTTEFPIKLQLKEERLFKLKIYENNSILREFVLFTEKEYRKKNYNKTIETQENNINALENSSYFLPSSYIYSSEKEENIILNINGFNKEKTLLPKPQVAFEDPYIKFIPGARNKILDTDNFYLCAIPEDEIYYSKAVPVSIRINNQELTFDYGQNLFENKPYYFYIGDKNLNRISDVTYIDLSLDYEDEDNTNYNQIYQSIHLNMFSKKLHKVFEENMSNVWPQIKTILDDYLNEENIEFIDIKDYLIENVCKSISRITYSIPLIIYYIELTEQKYYMPTKASFVQEHEYNVKEKLHKIKKGSYLTQVTGIDYSGNIFYFYFNGKEQGVFFRIDSLRYILFKNIDVDNHYNVSDFGYYYNPEKDLTYHKYNSLEVNITE